MRVPEQIIKCVGFLATGEVTSTLTFRGTAFFVGIDSPAFPKERAYMLLVTARHNVEGALASGDNLYLRVNRKDGKSELIDLATTRWFFPDDPGTDVALTPITFRDPEEIDLVYLSETMFGTDDKIEEHQIGIGDDLYVSGLFAYHHGTEQNLPIVRSGLIASMPSEAFIDEDSGEEFRAYLAELRSIGGLSGSPVFAVLPPGRILGDDVSSGPRHFFLIGLVRGHWTLNVSRTVSMPPETLNVGIALVTPIQEMLKILEQDEIVQEIKESDDEERKRREEGRAADSPKPNDDSLS